MNLQIKIKDLSATIDQKSLRQRILILLSSWLVVYAIWQILIFDNISNFTDKLSGGAAKLQKQITALQGQISAASNSIYKDPILQLEQQIKSLEEQKKSWQVKLDVIKTKLISPDTMTPLLKNILRKSNLKLISIKNLPPIPVISSSNIIRSSKDRSELDNTAKFKVYKHIVEINLNGGFFQTLDFINNIERSPEPLLLESLEFKINTYPKADVKILIGNLSVSDKIIGIS